MKITPLIVVAIIFLAGCSSSKKIVSRLSAGEIKELKLINEYTVPNGLIYHNTLVGGLSGIDYDEKKGLYYLICDDRSAFNPARYYTAKIPISSSGIDSVVFIKVDTLITSNGRLYATKTTDPEALRYNPITNDFIWTSEGDRIISNVGQLLLDPAITFIDQRGHFKDSITIPENMHMQRAEKGPRQNGVFEGLTFADNYKTLFVSVEEPIYEDGPRAGANDSTAIVRFLKFNLSTKKQLAQYAYRIESVAYPSVPANGFKINGIPDILSIGNNQFIVIERSFSTGRAACTIRIYLADASDASDVSSLSSLKDATGIRLIKKRLVLNMDSLNRYIDNVEGVTFGPVLPNGHRSLLFVADDNFSKDEKMQFFLFEIIPD